jgi:hypothetical protein
VRTRGIQRIFHGLAAVALATAAAGAEPRRLGEIRRLSGPTACDGEECYRIEIACPQVRETAAVRLKVREPAGAERGTILFASGGSGRALWEEFGAGAASTLDKLHRRGYRLVQLAWEDGWLLGAPGRLEGQQRLACRPATAARWVFDNLHSGADKPLCATGNSGGAAQIAFMLSHYGLEEILAAVVPTGGPPMGRIDQGCLRESADLRQLWYEPGAARTIDRGFGEPGDGSGPCASAESGFRRRFERASIAFGEHDFEHPATVIWFVFGENDTGSAVGQGLAYYDRLVAAGSPRLGMSVAPATPHQTPSTRKGARRIFKVLKRHCRLRD